MQDFRRIKAWQRDLDLLSPEEWQRYTAEVVEIRKMTYSYRRSMLANEQKASERKPNEAKPRPKTRGRRRSGNLTNLTSDI